MAKWLAAAALAAAALAGLLYSGGTASLVGRVGPAAAAEPPVAAAAAPEPAPRVAEPLDEAALVDELLARFGPHIHDKHAQIKLIEQLIRYAQRRDPDGWRDAVRRLLARLFPELAEALIARFEALERHNRWLADNRRTLMEMSAAQRREVLWAARYQAFGADADEIWAAERKSEALARALAEIETAEGAPTAERLDRLLAVIHETYGEQAPAFIAQRQTELLGRFLAISDVQEELRALPPAARGAALRTLRGRMGLDDAALDRWDELDRSRDAAWERGQQYMRARQALLAQPAAEQAQQLAQLRERTFGAEEAAVIAEEEAAGFYRFGGTRRIGRE